MLLHAGGAFTTIDALVEAGRSRARAHSLRALLSSPSTERTARSRRSRSPSSCHRSSRSLSSHKGPSTARTSSTAGGLQLRRRHDRLPTVTWAGSLAVTAVTTMVDDPDATIGNLRAGWASVALTPSAVGCGALVVECRWCAATRRPVRLAERRRTAPRPHGIGQPRPGRRQDASASPCATAGCAHPITHRGRRIHGPSCNTPGSSSARRRRGRATGPGRSRQPGRLGMW